MGKSLGGFSKQSRKVAVFMFWDSDLIDIIQGWIQSRVGRALAMHMADPGLFPASHKLPRGSI